MIDAQFFFKTITVTAPTSDQRDRILTHILATREIPHDESFSCRALAKRMDGFLPVDLVAITERAVHHAFNRTNGMGYCVRAEDVERAMKTYTPRGLAGVTLHKSGTTWADVGGMLCGDLQVWEASEH